MQNKKLTILTVTVSDTGGGAARAAYRIHKAVMKAGVEGHFLVKYKCSNDQTVISVDSFDTFPTLKVPYRWVQHKIINYMQRQRWRPYPNKQDGFMSDLRGSNLHGALRKIDYDILHLHWINLRFLDLRELQKINKPIVWTLHDCWPFTGVCHYFYECERYTKNCGMCPHLESDNANDLSVKVWKKKAKYYKGLKLHIVSPSNWLAHAARKSSLFKQFPVSVIPNPIDTDYFMPANKADACEVLNVSPKNKYILFGAMNALNDTRKGFLEFCKAMLYYEQHYYDSNTEVLIFGSNELSQMKLNHIGIKHLGILHDEKLLVAYRVAEVVVVPSLSENLSNVIMESMSCGTPVVAFDIGGNADLIEHKRNGYLAKALDTEDLAYGIKWCLENRTRKLSDHAVEKINDTFSSERVSSSYIKLYKELLYE